MAGNPNEPWQKRKNSKKRSAAAIVAGEHPRKLKLKFTLAPSTAALCRMVADAHANRNPEDAFLALDRDSADRLAAELGLPHDAVDRLSFEPRNVTIRRVDSASATYAYRVEIVHVRCDGPARDSEGIGWLTLVVNERAERRGRGTLTLYKDAGRRGGV